MAELTAELAETRDRVSYWSKMSERLGANVATARAAREQAESEQRTWFTHAQESLERMQRAERERATARALLERQGGSWLEVEALANRLADMQRERDTALARVKAIGELLGDESITSSETFVRILALVDGAAIPPSPAETALASARKLPALWRSLAAQYATGQDASYCVRGAAAELEEALTSHPSPAPVAAPCAGCVSAETLLRRAGQETQSTDAWWKDSRAWLKEHP